MKKIIAGISLVLLVLVSIMGSNVHAANESVNLQTSKNEYKKGDSFTVDVVLSGITTNKGAAGLIATLEYDKDSLELDVNNIKGQNSWADPNFNEENGMLITDKGKNVTGDETVLTLNFKVKENAKSNFIINLKDISVSGGEGEINISNASKTITIVNSNNQGGSGNTQGGNNQGNNNQSGNNQGGNNQGSNNHNNLGLNVIDNTASGKLPQTGASNTILIVGGIAASITAVAFFIKMKVLNIK